MVAAPGPIAVVDAAYGDTASAAASVLLADFAAAIPLASRVRRHPPAAPYVPGAFYRRELPLLLDLLAGPEAPPAAVVIDGYVQLDAAGAPGLGAHLAARLGGGLPVIGIAKTPLRADDWSRPLMRGASTRPLWITATGIDLDRAADLVRAMHGAARIPTAFRLADRLARDALAGEAGPG